MNQQGALQLVLQGQLEGLGQEGDAVLEPFAIAYDDLVAAKINIAHAQAHDLTKRVAEFELGGWGKGNFVMMQPLPDQP